LQKSKLQLQLAKAAIKINPTEGIRQLFGIDNLIAKWTARGLDVVFCAQVAPDKIFWVQKFG
jgi:hypothetical protein